MSTSIKVAEALLELRSVMRRRVDAVLSQKGLSFAKFKLLQLIEQKGPCKPSDLATALNQAPRSITQAVDTLERDGLIVRSPHPTDRRAQIIATTAMGRTLLGDAEGPKMAEIDAIFSVLDQEQQSHLLQLLNLVRARL